jgi:hypothetical protein
MTMTRCDPAGPGPADHPRTGRSGQSSLPDGAFGDGIIDRAGQRPAPVAEEWNWQLAATCRGMEVELFFHPARERKAQKQRRIDQAKRAAILGVGNLRYPAAARRSGPGPGPTSEATVMMSGRPTASSA